MAKVYNFFSSVNTGEEEVRVTQISKNEMAIEFNLRSLDIKEYFTELPTLKTQHKIISESFYSTKDEGKEELPFYSIIINQKPSDFETVILKGKMIALSDVRPFTYEGEKGKSRSSERPFYRSYYLGDYRGIHLTKIDLFPLTFDRDNQKLIIYPHLKMNIKSSNKVSKFKLQEKWNSQNEGFERLMIAFPHGYLEEIKSFVHWKEQIGHMVYTYQFSDFLDKKDRKIICQELEKEMINYLIIIGNNQLKLEKHFCSSKPKGSDLISDYYIGYITAENKNELENYLKSIIHYEKGEVGRIFGHSKYRKFFYSIEKIASYELEKDEFYSKKKINQRIQEKSLIPTLIPTNRPLPITFIQGLLQQDLISKYRFAGELFFASKLENIKKESSFLTVKDILLQNNFSLDPSLLLKTDFIKKLNPSVFSNTLKLKNEKGRTVSNARVIIDSPIGQKIFYSNDQGIVTTNFAIEGKNTRIISPEYQFFELDR